MSSCATGLLFGLGLLLGLAVAPVLAVYAKTDPSVLWQAAGATAAFVGALGSYGYATRRDLSSWARTLLWALLGLIVLGIVLIFVSIPQAHVIYAVAGLAIFGAFTIFDFNRLRCSHPAGAVPTAASIEHPSADAGLDRRRQHPGIRSAQGAGPRNAGAQARRRSSGLIGCRRRPGGEQHDAERDQRSGRLDEAMDLHASTPGSFRPSETLRVRLRQHHTPGSVRFAP